MFTRVARTLSTLTRTVKGLFYPSVHSLSADNAIESEKKVEDATQKGNKEPHGPLNVWGPRWGYSPCSLSVGLVTRYRLCAQHYPGNVFYQLLC